MTTPRRIAIIGGNRIPFCCASTLYHDLNDLDMLSAPLGAIDRSRLNVHGSSLAVGRPFAATGGRILATTAKLLAQRGGGRVLISSCTAGGMGVAAIVEVA
jgi:hypothetical protein